jgi:hypothetical protein
MLPPQKVPDLLDLVVISGKALFSTRVTQEGHHQMLFFYPHYLVKRL